MVVVHFCLYEESQRRGKVSQLPTMSNDQVPEICGTKLWTESVDRIVAECVRHPPSILQNCGGTELWTELWTESVDRILKPQFGTFFF